MTYTAVITHKDYEAFQAFVNDTNSDKTFEQRVDMAKELYPDMYNELMKPTKALTDTLADFDNAIQEKFIDLLEQRNENADNKPKSEKLLKEMRSLLSSSPDALKTFDECFLHLQDPEGLAELVKKIENAKL